MVRDVAARVRVACAESGARRSTGPGSASGQGVRALALFNVGTQICLKWQVLRPVRFTKPAAKAEWQ